MMITTKDIAALAGVSQTAVSAVLSGQGRQRRISEKTARKIMETAKRLGYRRNLAAQELRLGKSLSVGILLPVPTNNIYSYLTGALGPLLEEHGYLSSFAFWKDSRGQERAAESILCRCPSGIITVEPRHIPEATDIPVVSLITDDPRFDVVDFDGRDIFTQVIAYLHGLGHRRIAYPYSSMLAPHYRSLTEHFAAELTAHGLSTQWMEAFDGFSVLSQSNLPCLAKLVADWYEAMRDRPTAIVFPTDMLAIYFMREMTCRGYHLPEDLSVTGCDNIPFTEVVTPTLTSFGELSEDTLADALVTTLLHRMEEPSAPRSVCQVKRRLIARESTAPPKNFPAS